MPGKVAPRTDELLGGPREHPMQRNEHGNRAGTRAHKYAIRFSSPRHDIEWLDRKAQRDAHTGKRHTHISDARVTWPSAQTAVPTHRLLKQAISYHAGVNSHQQGPAGSRGHGMARMG